METRKQIEAEIVRLQEKLAALPKYNWDEMTDAELQLIFTSGGDWNSWKNCPVGSLTKGRYSNDHILNQLGAVCYAAGNGNWEHLVQIVRSITKIRLEELGR